MIYRVAILICFCISGCATVYPECEKYTESRQKQECINDVREYERVERTEQFRRDVAICKAINGTLQYKGYYSAKIKRILETEDWGRLHRTDMISFSCVK